MVSSVVQGLVTRYFRRLTGADVVLAHQVPLVTACLDRARLSDVSLVLAGLPFFRALLALTNSNIPDKMQDNTTFIAITSMEGDDTTEHQLLRIMLALKTFKGACDHVACIADVVVPNLVSRMFAVEKSEVNACCSRACCPPFGFRPRSASPVVFKNRWVQKAYDAAQNKAESKAADKAEDDGGIHFDFKVHLSAGDLQALLAEYGKLLSQEPLRSLVAGLARALLARFGVEGPADKTEDKAAQTDKGGDDEDKGDDDEGDDEDKGDEDDGGDEDNDGSLPDLEDGSDEDRDDGSDGDGSEESSLPELVVEDRPPPTNPFAHLIAAGPTLGTVSASAARAHA